MGNINASITVSQNSNDKKEVELVMNETETTGADAQTGKDGNASEKRQDNPTDEAGKVDFKFCWWSVGLFIVFVIPFIGSGICSVIFIRNICNICVPFNDSANFVACIQYTVSFALALAAVIVASISLLKAAKWLVKVDFIKQVLSSSCNEEQKKKYCDTLADL